MSMSQTERLARERMGLLKEGQSSYQASIQRSRSNPELAKLWSEFDEAERGILEVQAGIKRREYASNPGLAEAEARARIGLPAIDRPVNERPIEDSQVENVVRRQLGLRKIRD